MPVYSWTLYFCKVWHPSSYVLDIFALLHVSHHHSHITVCKANTRTAQQHVTLPPVLQILCLSKLSNGFTLHGLQQKICTPPGSLYFRSPVNPNALVFWLFHACFHVKRALHPKLSLVWNQISRSLKVPYCTPFRSFILGFDVLKNKYQKPSQYIFVAAKQRENARWHIQTSTDSATQGA